MQTAQPLHRTECCFLTNFGEPLTISDFTDSDSPGFLGTITAPRFSQTEVGHHQPAIERYLNWLDSLPSGKGAELASDKAVPGSVDAAGKFMTQTRPAGSNVRVADPLPSPKAAPSSFDPNPLLVGALTSGPPFSVHFKVTKGFAGCQARLTLPNGTESAPYLAALVASS